MIELTRLDGTVLYVNSDLIELVEATPDTVVSLSTGRKLVVKDSPAAIAAKVLEFARRAHEPSRLAFGAREVA
ncbi:MAG: flagellar FlbD family protein [Dehalococcoidia bacterium]|nr:flagellar FlbD family protein [Dehalococcoidia bacterium]